MKKTKITDYERCIVVYDFTLSMKNIIKLKGCSQNRLSKIISVDKSNFSKMLNRERLFSKSDLLRVLVYLEIPSSISINLFDYNGTTIKTNDEEDIRIRELLFDKRIKNTQDLEKIIKRI